MTGKLILALILFAPFVIGLVLFAWASFVIAGDVDAAARRGNGGR